MSTRRFLWALAFFCFDAVAAAAGESAAELELRLARTPSLYLRLDVAAGVLGVRVRGMELERFQVGAVRLVEIRAPGGPGSAPGELLPVVWKVVGDPEVAWRAVLAPEQLVPFDEDAERPTPVPNPVSDEPVQISVGLDNGWTLHLGPDPPTGWWRRISQRLGTGWRRLTGSSLAPPPPALVVELRPEDSRSLLHILRDGTALLVVCGGGETAAAEAIPAG
jgi:hypothetical protein